MNFNLSIQTNAITPRNQLTADMQNVVPEGALYFEGVVSD